MRGYNLTDKPEGVDNYNVALLAKDVKEVIQGLGYSKAYLMAHDWGGAIAWRTAMMFPEVIEKLIICNVPHPKAMASGKFEQLLKSWYIFMFQTPGLAELAVRADDFRMFNAMFHGRKAGLKNKENMTAEDLEAWKYVFGQEGALTPPINYYRCMPKIPPIRSQDSIIEPPTLVIFGTGDAFLTVTGARKSLEYCKDGRLRLIEGASHWVMQDEPDKVNEFVEEFLREDPSEELDVTVTEADSPAHRPKL